MSGMLEGVLVVSIEQAVAAPYATARMADEGARVIKVEREGGDFARGYDRAAGGESAFFLWLNRGKESLELDFKNAEDAALLHRLLARADVFLQNLAPGAAERAGFGADALRAAHPRLVTCAISGYGDEEPYRNMKAYDMLVQAESGLASITGTPDAPGRIGVSACDIGTGHNAHAAILQALYARERTGEGARLDISMFGAMADWMAVPFLFHHCTGNPMARTGLSHPLVAPYGAYPVKGGGQLLIAIQNEREWRRFTEAVLERPDMAEHPDFADNVERVTNREALDREIRTVFEALDRDVLEERLRTHAIAFGAINSVVDLAAHPALRTVNVQAPTGTYPIPASPVRVNGETAAPGPVPALGEHSEALRAEFAGA